MLIHTHPNLSFPTPTFHTKHDTFLSNRRAPKAMTSHSVVRPLTTHELRPVLGH